MNLDKFTMTVKDGADIESVKREAQQLSQISIFPETEDDTWFHKKLVKTFTWLVQKANDLLNRTSASGKRWNWIHKHIKPKCIVPGLKLIRLLFGKYMITNDSKIPLVPWNNLIRIERWAWEQGMFDMRRYMCYRQVQRNGNKELLKKYPHPVAYAESLYNHSSEQSMRVIKDVLMTIVMEDTAYREWLNNKMLLSTHAIMSLYGVSDCERAKVPFPGQLPTFMSNNGKDPAYFFEWKGKPSWKEPERITMKLIRKMKREREKQNGKIKESNQNNRFKDTKKDRQSKKCTKKV